MLEEGNSRYRSSLGSKYFHKSSSAKFWIIQLLKMPVLLLFPYGITIDNYEGRFVFEFDSLFWSYYSEYRFRFEFSILNLITAYILTIPGFYYVHKLRQADPNKSIWKLGIAIAAISQLLPSFISGLIVRPFYDMYYSYSMFYSLVPFYVVIGYVVGPIVNREIQNVSHSFTRCKGSSSLREQISKIHFPLWISVFVLMIGPVFIIYNMYSYSTVISSFTSISLLIYTYGYTDLYNNISSLYIAMAYYPTIYLITGIFCLGNILFFRHLIRYFHGKCSQKDALKYGVFGAIWPYLFYYIIEYLYSSLYYTSNLMPLPLLIIVGLLAMRMGNNVHYINSRKADQIWEEERIVSPVPEEKFEEIKVPIWYTIISRFRKNERSFVHPEEFDTPVIEKSHKSDGIKVPLWYSIISRFRKKEVEAWDPDTQIENPWSNEESE